MATNNRDAYGYTEAQYEAADRILDERKDERMLAARRSALEKLGERFLEMRSTRRTLPRPPSITRYWEQLEREADALGLLGTDAPEVKP